MLIRITLALLIGLPVGAALSWNIVRTERSVAAVRVGPWVTYPDQGRADADPYLRARTAAEGIIPLGTAEGIAFTAVVDSAGRPLRLECDYRLSGPLPPARLWTLEAVEAADSNTQAGRRSSAFVVSRSLLRESGTTPEIAIGPRPAAGNWLKLSGSGRMQLTVRLYDAPIAADPELFGPAMPAIEPVRSCAPPTGSKPRA